VRRSLLAWWRQRTVRTQLAFGIVSIGLLAIALNAGLLTIFFHNDSASRQESAMRQQATLLSACCGSQPGSLLAESPDRLAAIMEIAMASAPRRMVIVMASDGSVRYASPMSSNQFHSLLAHARGDYAAGRAQTVEDASRQIVVDTRLHANAATGQTSGEIVLAEDLNVAVSQWQRAVMFVLSSGAIALILVFIGGIVAATRIARPIRHVTATAHAIAEGDYNRRADAAGFAETTELSHAFNRMIETVLRHRQAQRDLLANVSHELGAPLSLIRGYAEAISDGVIADPTQQQLALAAIATETDRLGMLIDDLLDLTRLESGQVRFTLEPVALGELLHGIYERFQPLAEQRGIALKCDVPDDLPIITTDGLRLEQVFINLVRNAFHATGSGGMITLGGCHGAHQVIVSVRDTGRGIPAEMIERIWERFYQTDNSRDRRGSASGVGLGLPISRSIVTSLGGSIAVESDPGRQTTFTVSLNT
jgi:signal transduction histidine kinase